MEFISQHENKRLKQLFNYGNMLIGFIAKNKMRRWIQISCLYSKYEAEQESKQV